MLLFTPSAVHEAVIEALTQRFDDRERLINVEAGTVTILAVLDPTRSGKLLDIW
jgi:N-acetylmuramic acid 6-phosphate (MurNAc-6-P) etherase